MIELDYVPLVVLTQSNTHWTYSRFTLIFELYLLRFAGENFVVFRDTKGMVHVLDAYCPHLGANLGIGGKVRGNCIECPFHGWQFDGHSGKCTTIPYSATERESPINSP